MNHYEKKFPEIFRVYGNRLDDLAEAIVDKSKSDSMVSGFSKLRTKIHNAYSSSKSHFVSKELLAESKFSVSPKPPKRKKEL